MLILRSVVGEAILYHEVSLGAHHMPQPPNTGLTGSSGARDVAPSTPTEPPDVISHKLIPNQPWGDKITSRDSESG